MIDGSEDCLVSYKMYALAGDEMVIFRKKLIASQPAKTLKEVTRKPSPPKSIKQKGNAEGIKLLDLADEETPLEDIVHECNNKV